MPLLFARHVSKIEASAAAAGVTAAGIDAAVVAGAEDQQKGAGLLCTYDAADHLL